MVQVIRKGWLWLLAIGLFIWIWRQVPWTEVWVVLQAIPLTGLVAIALLDIVIVLTMSGRWWFLLRGLGHHLPYLQLCGYRLAAIGISYFTPGPQFGGEPLQVWSLTRFHGVASNVAIAAVTVDKLLELVVNFTILVWGVVVVVQTAFGQTAVFPTQSTLLATGFALALWCLPLSLLLLLARGTAPLSALLRWASGCWPWLQQRPWFEKMNQTVTESERQIVALWQHAPRQPFLALLVTLLNWALWFGEFWLMYALLGVRLGLAELLVLLTAARIAFLLPLPSGLGSLEAGQVLAVMAIGETAVLGLSATLLIRLRDLVLAGFGLWLSGRLVQRGRTS